MIKHTCLHGYSSCEFCPACRVEMDECPACIAEADHPARRDRGSQTPDRVREWLLGQAKRWVDENGGEPTFVSDMVLDAVAVIEKLMADKAAEAALVHFYKKTEQYKRREADTYGLALGLIAESCANPKRVAQEALEKFKCRPGN